MIEAARDGSADHQPEAAVVDICASIALRDLNLVDSLLSLLEKMEENEADPDRLAELYKLDHLAARLRRNAENLRVLAGRDVGDTAAETTSLVDVIRAAMSSIDDYARVSVGKVLSLGVVGLASDDLGRVLAELLDNATKQSPPDSSVRVSAHLTEQGSVLMRIEDEGIGLPADRLSELNNRLSVEPRLDDDSVRHMGLAVVRRLATRHDMRVRLNRRAPHGTTATVLIPAGLVAELPEAAWSGAQTVAPRTPADPAPRPAKPRPASSATGVTGLGGLPKRRSSRQTVPPTPEPVKAGTTANGLPRRVSRSIKNPEYGGEAAGKPVDEQAGHEQLLADLDAFADGEQAALADKDVAKDAAKPSDEPAGKPPDEPTGESTDDSADATARPAEGSAT